jgi:dTDP-4-dehydrorhamnose reductase
VSRLTRTYKSLEVWGGVESTYNRVGDRYLDQLARNGHAVRPDDLDLFAELGIRALRYPVLWERIAPNGIDEADWSWSDQRLERLRELHIEPMLGLVHHGSGPKNTSLLDPLFPELLAEFATAVARRYPWVDVYTPVNEPLTTARFSGLYGHWYPHKTDDLSFARALLGQCRATVLAMRAIRQINPRARLLQTEDLGKTYSSPMLRYQAAFENERRWVSCDLLTGRLTPDLPMWAWLVSVGIAEEDLAWFLDNPCSPDILGFNTYLSSERYLDERVDLFPGETPGSNGRHRYVDVLAARVLPQGIAGTEGLLGEAWSRYHLPLAVTEVHNGGTREEQLRWLHDVWRGAERAREAGADVRAVTVWSMLGSYDWSSLVTRDEGIYEPGVFDVRSPRPRATAIARMVRELATGSCHDHPVLSVPGWWHRTERFIYSPQPMTTRSVNRLRLLEAQPTYFLILGNDNPLLRALVTACNDPQTHRRVPYRWLDTRSMDLTDHQVVQHILDHSKAWAVAVVGSLSPWTRHGEAVIPLARAVAADLGAVPSLCGERSLPLMVFGSEIVFDGCQPDPYTESSAINPLDRAGERQASVEEQAIKLCSSTLVIRTGPLFGPRLDNTRVRVTAPFSAGSRAASGLHEEVISPTYLPDLANAVLDLLIDGERGVWHVANEGAVSWGTFQRSAADPAREGRFDVPPDHQGKISRALSSERGWILPHWSGALQRHRSA